MENRKIDIHFGFGGGEIIGTVLAMILSWTKWHSVRWVIIHGIFNWFYVIYYLLKYGF